jgi:hypothetical protein
LSIKAGFHLPPNQKKLTLPTYYFKISTIKMEAMAFKGTKTRSVKLEEEIRASALIANFPYANYHLCKS